VIDKSREVQETFTSLLREFEALYLEFLKQFYEKENRPQAKKLALRLDKLLADSNELAESIRGEEVRSLIAELRGDLVKAVQSREAEIRKILELHALSANTPSWEFVSREYGFSDVSDRLDLLAILYDEQGMLDRAISVLIESKNYCKAHHIRFDSQDLLNELQSSQPSAK
jgi:hypothetical protein